jgi:hypothetical protein
MNVVIVDLEFSLNASLSSGGVLVLLQICLIFSNLAFDC